MNRRALLAAIFVVAGAACRKTPRPTPARPIPDPPVVAASVAPAAAPAPPGSALVDRRTVNLAVYVAGDVPPAMLADATKRVADRFPDVPMRTSMEGERPPLPVVVVFAPPIGEFAPPRKDLLDYFGRGLDDAQKQAASRAKGVLVMTWLLDADPKFARLRAAQQLALDVATRDHGFVWDELTRELYTPDAFRSHRFDGWDGDLPDVRRFFIVHFYSTDDGRHRAVSLGLAALGLPDLVVEDVTPAQADAMNTAMNAAAQLLLEGAVLDDDSRLEIDLAKVRHPKVRADVTSSLEPGARRHAKVHLVQAKAEEGDPTNRLLEMRFDDAPGATTSERQAAALDALFGSSEESLAGAREDDPELAAATARVQAKLPSVKAAFARSLAPRERLSVKAPFDTDDGTTEWMWVDVDAWDGEVLRGTLLNDPTRIHALHLGAKVEVKQASVADYLLRKADGTVEGGESIRIFERRERKRP